MSFASGIHFCLGAALARAEGQVVFDRLLERFTSIELATDAPRFRNRITLRGSPSSRCRSRRRAGLAPVGRKAAPAWHRRRRLADPTEIVLQPLDVVPHRSSSRSGRSMKTRSSAPLWRRGEQLRSRCRRQCRRRPPVRAVEGDYAVAGHSRTSARPARMSLVAEPLAGVDTMRLTCGRTLRRNGVGTPRASACRSSCPYLDRNCRQSSLAAGPCGAMCRVRPESAQPADLPYRRTPARTSTEQAGVDHPQRSGGGAYSGS